MSTIGGFAALRERMKERMRQGGGGGGGGPRIHVPEFRLFDSPEERKAVIWFVGAQSSPYVYEAHRVKVAREGRKPKYEKFRCALDKAPTCAWCDRSASSDAVARPSAHAAFTVIDTRWVIQAPWIRDGEVVKKSDGSQVMVQKPCKQGTPGAERAGRKAWYLSVRYAETLDTQATEVAQRCANCWNPDPEECGLIEHLAWECAKCSHRVTTHGDYAGLSAVKCPRCKFEGRLREVVECSKCDSPRRVSYGDGPWVVTKSGSQKNTNWNFQFLGLKEPPEWILDYEPLDFDQILTPTSPERVAAIMGEKRRNNTQSYDDYTGGYEEPSGDDDVY